MHSHICRIAAVAIALTAVACGPVKNTTDENTPPVGTGAKQTKSMSVKDGGQVAVEGAQLNVPPGALPADTSITVTSTTEPAPETYKPISPLYKFEPEGLEFAQPAEIVLPAPATGADKVVIYWSKKSGPGFDVLATRVVGNELHAFVTHFSMGFCGDAQAAQDNGATVVTSCGVPATADCPQTCSISCEGDTQARCSGAGTKNCDANGNCSSTCATPTCTCEPIPHTCSVPADTACHFAGCNANCSGDTPLAVCSQSSDKGSTPDAGTGGGTGTCSCPAGQTCDAQGACVSACGPAPTCSCRSLANTGGGGGTADAGTPTQACATDADCQAGVTCLNGVCAGKGDPNGGSDGGTGPGPGCAVDADCGAGLRCVNHACSATNPCPAGQSCDGGTSPACVPGSRCPDGTICDANGQCGGKPTGCTSDADCGAGGKCVGGQCSAGPQCDTNHPCPAGLSCVDSRCVGGAPDGGTSTGCVPGSTCPDGTTCRADGTCGGAPNPGGCHTDADCGGHAVCDAASGKCTPVECSATIPCPGGMSCVANRCQPSGGTDAGPAPGCAPGSICPDGTTCKPDGTCGGPPAGGGCHSDIDCGPRAACDVASGKCSPVECSASFPCPTGMSCVANRCQPAGGGADAGSGSACTPGSTCPDGTTCQPNGTCGGPPATRPVGATCSASVPCGGSEICFAAQPSAYCTVTCVDSAQCAQYGMACATSGQRVCVRPGSACATDHDCPAGQLCNAGQCK